MSIRKSRDEFSRLIEELDRIRAEMARLVDDSADLLNEVDPRHQVSARNLLHYLALRGRDLRPLQARLAALGLSSLGRAESHVMVTVDAVLRMLRVSRAYDAAGSEDPACTSEISRSTLEPIDVTEGQRILDENTTAVLGPHPPGRGVAIMVTMPSEAADDYTLVSSLLQQGMDCMRINCAHDTPDAWARMIEHLRRAEARHGRQCRVLMDLAGPKVRTSALEQGPAVVKFGPRRDAYGRVMEPGRVWLFAQEDPRPSPTPADASIPVPAEWLMQLRCGDGINFVDTRDANRTLRVVAADLDGRWCEAHKTCYVQEGTALRLDRPAAEGSNGAEVCVGPLPAPELPLKLANGDELVVTRSTIVGRNAIHDERNHLLTPAMIGCTADRIFDDVRTGDRVWFDDGKIGGVVERREADRLHVRITRARVRGARLGSEKGINLPDTELRLPAITEKDRADLEFAARHADMIALSFVNAVADVRELRTLLEPLGGAQPAIVLKIETRRGFEHLPALLLEAMKAPRCAVMIARGDLAVESGFERMAEVQEEILWICEAGHVPVIWATQVLETLAKEGMPSRAEVTDAAMAHRAECVMLNKGPFIVQAVKVLDDILRRMHGHQAKKRAMLRELQLVSAFRNVRNANRAAVAG